ncbi:hypothetical protein ABIA39_004512 [Nocardia sp. GAS34]|uniref:hypothetical protein n=1 Tax=unclassified Nocardia TaxID=2637762 RepID=UPI003D1FF928
MNSGVPLSDSPRPPILARLHQAPAAQGLTIPFVTLCHHGRRAPVWGGIDPARLHTVLSLRLCQICGQRLEDRVVVMLRPQDWLRGIAPEPGMHPECAHYSTRSCPVLSGRMSHHRPAATSARMTRCTDPRCDCGLWKPPTAGSDEDVRAGKPIDAWYALWIDGDDYEIVHSPDGDRSLGAAGVRMRGVRVLGIRKVRDATENPDTGIGPATPTVLDFLATQIISEHFARSTRAAPDPDASVNPPEERS